MVCDWLAAARQITGSRKARHTNQLRQVRSKTTAVCKAADQSQNTQPADREREARRPSTMTTKVMTVTLMYLDELYQDVHYRNYDII